MRNLFFSAAIFFCCGCKSSAQITQSACKSEFDVQTNELVYKEVDSKPEFPGGDIAFLKYFASNFTQSEANNIYQTEFKFQFVIDTAGFVKGERIKGKKLNEITTVEKDALNLLKNMPRWKPGICQGKLVPVLVNMPIKI